MSFSNLRSQQKKESKEEIKKKPKQEVKITREKINQVKKNTLKHELRILIECLGFGHGKYKEFPQYNIQNSSHLKARINEIIDLISK